MSLLRRLIRQDDDLGESTIEKLKEHEAAVSENRAAHESSRKSTTLLENAVLLSRMRSLRFAEFEKSIKENHENARSTAG